MLPSPSGKSLCLFAILLSVVPDVTGDVYFHNPRGSNNRLDEATRNRKNANRIFDSQNNARGGYNVGSKSEIEKRSYNWLEELLRKRNLANRIFDIRNNDEEQNDGTMYYYAGSKLQIEWTNQHSCNSPNSNCELVLQYMCGEHVRDGTTTTTIPDNPRKCKKSDCDTDHRYGMHESFDHYLQCSRRERNNGLFTADQNLKRKNARSTRQNAAGTRRGYECPEERDYYPYWHPTPWKDIAVMTNDVSRCDYYSKESANVKGRWACHMPAELLIKRRNIVVPNNKEDCENFVFPKRNGIRGEWKYYPAHALPAPDCIEAPFSRDNHNGNGIGGHPNVYNWTVPDIDEDNCVLRIRYNISTDDYDRWDIDSSSNSNQDEQPIQTDLAEKYQFDDSDAAEGRGYIFEGNPEVNVFEGDIAKKFVLKLAINTAQFGRVFQDRSHTFSIRERPKELEGVNIQNLNVRGKRGNIVQVYPAVEYDFVPNTIVSHPDDYIHIQWTGSNTNPKNNDGQGEAGTDRNNLVLLGEQVYPEGSGVNYGPGKKYGHYGVNYPMHLNDANFLGFSKDDLKKLALLGNPDGDMSELDDADPYFDLGPKKVTRAGTYHYMCTRNNNFSNRDQKARVLVYPS